MQVGDHIYTDAALAKINFRWRTALIVRALAAPLPCMHTSFHPPSLRWKAVHSR